MPPFILLENRKGSPTEHLSLYFTDPSDEIICYDPNQLTSCLDQIEEIRGTGYYLVGFVSYEAGYLFDSSIVENYLYNEQFPLVHFFSFKHCERLTQSEVAHVLEQLSQPTEEDSFFYNITLNIDNEEYQKNIYKIKQHLYQGNTYQVNFTGKFKFDLQGEPVSLYRKLREQQKVEYAALFHVSDYQLLSLSPELFFSKQEDTLMAKPMKGTMPRSIDAELDEKNKALLKTDSKLIAENIIIVDLLRNDLSTISLPGSVSVSKLLHVETYETIHQTTSTIHSKINVNTSFKTLLHNLFPSGSITGAPKRKTMQIIHECEREPRNIYTGTIGYITPTNDMCFNVAIRTLLLCHNKGELGVGGGIIIDSNPAAELEELKLKARFFTEMAVNFKLVESIKYTPLEGFFLFLEHVERLKKSAKILHFSFDETFFIDKINKLKSILTDEVGYKIRIILQKNGQLEIEHALLTTNQQEKYWIMLCEQEIMNSNNVLLQHKTIDSTIRMFYEAKMKQHSRFFDVVFMNERGEITESSRANIFIQIDGKIITPSLSSGLLPGTMRKKILSEDSSIEQACIYKDDLYRAERIWLTNSIHGMQEVFLWKD